MTARPNPSRNQRGADFILAGVAIVCTAAGAVLSLAAGAPRAPGMENAIYFPALLGMCAGAGAVMLARIVRLAFGRRGDEDDDLHSR